MLYVMKYSVIFYDIKRFTSLSLYIWLEKWMNAPTFFTR